jgi:guanylate kinase
MAKIFVISGVSGVGKSSLIKALFKDAQMANNTILSISYTTRTIRPREINGKDYIFISTAEFQSMIANNEFIEYATVYNNYYGTSKKFIETQLNANKNVIVEIDWQGALQIKDIFQEQAVLIYIKPPSWDKLVDRLTNRKTDSQETIQLRLNAALEEFQHIKHYNFVVINDDFDLSVLQLREIINNKNFCED